MLGGEGALLSPSGTMVCEMVSIVFTMVCVDIGSLLCVLLIGKSLLGVSCWILLVQCGLPRPLILIYASVFLICLSVESSVASVSPSVSEYIGVGYTSIHCPW